MARADWHRYDKATKWLIQHHGDSLLRLAGVQGVVTWQALQAELVQPHQLPDGLLEVQVAGQPDKDWFILELATYPEPRLQEQVLRDLALVYLDRGFLPEVVSVVLHPWGTFRPGGTLDVRSRLGLTQWQIRWRVVELWTLPGEELLQVGDVGLVPWVPLTNFAGPPEAVFRQCRERIDQEASPEEHGNLLAVAHVLASLRYNDRELLALFGGEEAMLNLLEFPAVQEIVAKRAQQYLIQYLIEILRARFKSVPEALISVLETITDESKLKDLFILAATCQDLETFRRHLPELPGPESS